MSEDRGLVDRLRDIGWGGFPSLRREAANEIERLRAQRDDAYARADKLDETAAELAGRLEASERALREAREALASTEQMLSKHIEEFHDFDYEPHQVPLELAELRQIQHHILGSLMDAPTVCQDDAGGGK